MRTIFAIATTLAIIASGGCAGTQNSKRAAQVGVDPLPTPIVNERPSLSQRRQANQLREDDLTYHNNATVHGDIVDGSIK